MQKSNNKSPIPNTSLITVDQTFEQVTCGAGEESSSSEDVGISFLLQGCMSNAGHNSFARVDLIALQRVIAAVGLLYRCEDETPEDGLLSDAVFAVFKDAVADIAEDAVIGRGGQILLPVVTSDQRRALKSFCNEGKDSSGVVASFLEEGDVS